MQVSKTVTGKDFQYDGTLATGITVYFKTPARMTITPEIIQVIRSEITERSPVLMGACREPLVGGSIGETLWLKHRVTPQAMSYVLPLLVAEGYCTVSTGKPIVVQRTR